MKNRINVQNPKKKKMIFQRQVTGKILETFRIKHANNKKNIILLLLKFPESTFLETLVITCGRSEDGKPFQSRV